MSKKRELILGGLVVSILLISFVSADIFLINQPDEVYNLDDTLNVEIGSDGTSGWGSVNLVCGQQDKMLFFKYIQDSSNSQITAPLTKEFLRGTLGDCKLVLGFNGLKSESFPFKISDKINIDIQIQGNEFNPGDIVIFTGHALKENDLYVDGNADISFSGSDLRISVPIIDEGFSGNITLPSNIGSGAYTIMVFVSEKDAGGNVTNYGSMESSLNVKQLPTRLSIETDSSVVPGNEINFKSLLYDQTNNIIEGYPSTIRLTNVNNTEVMSKLANTGETVYYSVSKNAPFGKWIVSSEVEGLSDSKEFYVDKNMEADFELVNGTLYVRNVGNVPYDKKIEMKIGNSTNVTNLNLSVGKSVEFELSAPDGEYDIGINDGEASAEWSGVSLTGKSISFGTSRSGKLSFLNRSIIPWVFVILVLGVFIFVSSRFVIKKNFTLRNKNKGSLEAPIILSKDPSGSDKGGVVKVDSSDGRNQSSESKSPKLSSIIPVHGPLGDEAMPSSSIDGAKQSAAIIALKIKNYDEIKNSKSNALESLNHAIKEITSNHGKVYKNGDIVVGIFAPVATKTFENCYSAVRVAKDISGQLNHHNSKFTHKIHFGIGVNEGDIVAKKDQGRLLFSPLGNSLIGAKKVAEVAHQEVLLTEEANKKVMGSVKTKINENRAGVRSYSIHGIVDRSENGKFIESFLRRNQEFKSLRDYKSGK